MKITRTATLPGVAALIAAMSTLSGCNPGGGRSNYPAKDHDPNLQKSARSIQPIIQGIETYRKRTGRLPATLNDLDLERPAAPPVYYLPKDDAYMLSIKLGWAPLLLFSSKDRSWTFDPGDGSAKKKINLKVEQLPGAEPVSPGRSNQVSCQ